MNDNVYLLLKSKFLHIHHAYVILEMNLSLTCYYIVLRSRALMNITFTRSRTRQSMMVISTYNCTLYSVSTYTVYIYIPITLNSASIRSIIPSSFLIIIIIDNIYRDIIDIIMSTTVTISY